MSFALGEPHLTIDYGTAYTVAVVTWPDGRWARLSFAGIPALSNAVHRAPDGELVVGAPAWQRVAGSPDGFVEMPLRAGIGTLLVAGAEVEVADLVAAGLREVAAQASVVVGAPVGAVRMVVPAGWGPRRRTWLRRAAAAAGLGQPELVEAPAAAAEQLLASGVTMQVGALVLVCDVGAGFEVTIVRRGPFGFEVLSTLADPDAGGARIDDLLLERLFGQNPGISNTATQEPARQEPTRARWAAVAATRQGKEALTYTAAVTVPLPPPAVPTVMTSAMVDDMAAPVLRRAGELAVAAVRAAEVEVAQLAGVYCIGAASSMPAVARVLSEHLGTPVQVAADPGFTAVLGAAGAHQQRDSAPPEPAAAMPPLRRTLTLAIPGLAALVLLLQSLLMAELNNGSRILRSQYYYVIVNWGALAMASTLAVVTALGFGTYFGIVLARTRQPRTDTRPAGTSSQVPTGILLAAATGTAIAALLAVVTAVYLAIPINGPLRWALLPVLPAAGIAVVTAGLAATRGWRPYTGWDAFLVFPTSSVAAGTLGMLLLGNMQQRVRPQNLNLLLAGARIGGLLIGIAVACALAQSLLGRLIIGIPLSVFMAAIVDWPTIGIMGVAYAIGVAGWWAHRLWSLTHSHPAGNATSGARTDRALHLRGGTVGDASRPG
jgi:hypothetical protein